MIVETPAARSADLPDSGDRLRRALHDFIKPRLNWAAKTVLLDPNPSLPGNPDGITNRRVLRYLKDRRYTKDFVPDPAITQYLASALEAIIFRDAPAANADPLVLAEAALAESQLERQAGEVIWKMAIRHYQLTDLDFARMEQSARVLQTIGRAGRRDSLMNLAYKHLGLALGHGLGGNSGQPPPPALDERASAARHQPHGSNQQPHADQLSRGMRRSGTDNPSAAFSISNFNLIRLPIIYP